jgi:hypothetical protein
MNAPFFDTANLHHPYGTNEWVIDFFAEETRCCKDIDARTDKNFEELGTLLKESISVEKQLEMERGFIARLKLTVKLHKLEREIKGRYAVMGALAEARLRRTPMC